MAEIIVNIEIEDMPLGLYQKMAEMVYNDSKLEVLGYSVALIPNDDALISFSSIWKKSMSFSTIGAQLMLSLNKPYANNFQGDEKRNSAVARATEFVRVAEELKKYLPKE